MRVFVILFILIEAWMLYGVYQCLVVGPKRLSWWKRVKRNWGEEIFWMWVVYTIMAVGVAAILTAIYWAFEALYENV